MDEEVDIIKAYLAYIKGDSALYSEVCQLGCVGFSFHSSEVGAAGLPSNTDQQRA